MEKLFLLDGTSYDLKMAGFYFTSNEEDKVGFEILTDKTIEELETIFTNTENTKTLTVKRNDLTLRTYEGYTILGDQFEITKGYREDKNLIKFFMEMPELEYENLPETKLAISYAIQLMSNEQALNCKSVFPKWETFIGGEMKKNTRFTYSGELYIANQDISVVLENQYPSMDTAALYSRIDEEHEGTYEDPIPYSQMMTVEEGKYYLEEEIIYKCIRSSEQPLYATCASLVGNYFEVAEAPEDQWNDRR